MKQHWFILFLASFQVSTVLGCLPTNERQAQFGTETAQVQQPIPPQQGQEGFIVQQPPQQVFSAARVAAAGRAPNVPISTGSQSGVGDGVTLTEFTADGYNAEGGGPVNSGTALTCKFDGRPCCWANVPSPDDQLDWHLANGAPNSTIFRNVPAPHGSYLVAYARAAAPSDEAQFASCSIGCSASDITVRARHWTSENVLLQVCLRESFPNAGVVYNPLLNCQEFPASNGLTATELVLPKTSLVDIVFVASNFIGEHGDLAILSDIEVSYDRNGPECQEPTDEQVQSNAVQTRPDARSSKIIEESTNNRKSAIHGEKTLRGDGTVDSAVEERKYEGDYKRHGDIEKHVKEARGRPPTEGSSAKSALERFGEEGFKGGNAAFKSQKSVVNAKTAGPYVEETVIKSTKTSSGQNVAKGTKTQSFSESICSATKCDFESGNTCHYKDAYQSQSIRGMTTKFEVVSGQFMNRVTGVKESIEGDYYAATFLYPREMAGLEVDTDPFTEKSRLRFQYYEGTHGVQLKGCCGSIEKCPFSSDKFVKVSDRVWKTASFRCPKGTDKVIFLCENTRTNQGACAIDDLGMVESEGSLKDIRPLC
ncbi:hypothetical protein DICVIV_13175 [Dictyocaulus viviparus]|uniref:Uncharacterized protein n=1 Tax=Dictyocaulus viviparus TaxID=29172 RepID=A0A0D8XB37_DICVI|nr:hypothetical protein DICVIV_13175 [Dictyocaulus viviparus]